jgi:serine/threonine protein phosphatase PrpC
MLCPLCHTPNRDNAKFCKGCGRILLMENAADQSGAALPTDSAIVEAPMEANAEQTPGEAPVSPSAQTTSAAQEPTNTNDMIVPASSSISPRPQTLPAKADAQADRPTAQADDPSLAPTQILLPDKMIAYQAKRWQEELEREQREGQGQPAQLHLRHAGDIADAPTMTVSPSVPSQDTPAGVVRQRDIADMPTILFSPDEYMPVPPALPQVEEPGAAVEAPPLSSPAVSPQAAQEGDSAVAADKTAAPLQANIAGNVERTTRPEATSDADAVASSPIVEQGDVMEQTTPPNNEAANQSPPAPETASTTGDFPVIDIGTLVAGRYEVTQVLSTENSQHIYQVLDRQGYQHCWNCGSEQNADGDEFCIDCGAELLNASYIMHEFPAAVNGSGEADVLQETIINTFVDQGYTYVITQPQTTQSPFPNGVYLLAASDSDAGDVRRSEPNEDSTLVLQMERVHESIASPIGVFIVADGMGGHENGQGASRMAIGTIAERMVREVLAAPLTVEARGDEPDGFDEDTLVGLLQGAVEDANAAICHQNQQNKTDMGSTITGFMVAGDHSYILNVGDSRTYMLRDNTLYQLTNDHSLVGQLVAGGLIEPDEVYTHPQRSQIYRSLGDKLNVQIDIFKQQLHPGDKLLSCSDGLWEMVRNPQITDILASAPDPQTACAKLIEVANANGGEDNVSAVIVFVR